MDDHQGFTTTDLVEGAGAMSEQDLAAALGEEAPQPEPAAEAPAIEQEQRWVHEPTGREFDSELEFLRYESGWKDNKYGTDNKTLRAKLEAYEEMVKGAGEQPREPVDPKKQEELVFQAAMRNAGIDLEAVDPSAYKTIWKIFEAGLGMYDQGVVNRRFTELQGTVEKITTRAQQAEALNSAGVSIEQVKEVLEKHPSLKALPMGEQVAVIADLVKREQPKQGTGESPNAIRQALQPKAAGHVEGSAHMQPRSEESGFEEMVSKLDGNDRDFLKKIGLETSRAPKPWDDDFGG